MRGVTVSTGRSAGSHRRMLREWQSTARGLSTTGEAVKADPLQKTNSGPIMATMRASLSSALKVWTGMLQRGHPPAGKIEMSVVYCSAVRLTRLARGTTSRGVPCQAQLRQKQCETDAGRDMTRSVVATREGYWVCDIGWAHHDRCWPPVAQACQVTSQERRRRRIERLGKGNPTAAGVGTGGGLET